jgi:hypothetical protein
MGVPEIILAVVGVGLGLLPFIVALWAVFTLREVQQSVDTIGRRLETIEQLLRTR